MSEPVSPQYKPYAVEVEAEKTYYWCACGRSKSQPYCDGSHYDIGWKDASGPSSEATS